MRTPFSLLVLLAICAAVFTRVDSATAQSTPPDASQTAPIQYEERTLVHNGRERHYLLYAPPQASSGDPVPLVFMLHGGGGRPEIYEEVTRFGELARTEGFVLVYPAGSGRLGSERLLTWNAGHCCGFAMERGIDDVGFFRQMVSAVTAEFNIDPNRIYTAGHSNGGIMSYWLAAEMSDVFAAVGIVAGTIGGYPTPESPDLIMIPQPAQPVSVIHIHGMEDDNLRYEGGVNDDETRSHRNDLSVAESISFWVSANRCGAAETTTRDEGMVIVEMYTCPKAVGVTLISIVDGGHSWPSGNAPRRTSDSPSQRVNATEEIWAFFEAHPKETPPKADASGG